MARIDEKQEAIAKIRMAIDSNITACAKIEAELDEINSDHSDTHNFWAAPDNANGNSPHWIFGSPEKPINSRALEMENLSFKEFDERLRDFLSLCLPNEAIRYEDPILVSP